MKNKFNIVSAVCFLIIPLALAQETPKTMMAVTVKRVEPAESASFLSQPKKFWRAGTKYARIEEAPDAVNRVHGLVIVNEPDAWMINLFDKSGRHMVDPGPTFNARLPIFDAISGASAGVTALEFGRELEFFAKDNAKRSGIESIRGKPTDRYELTVDTSKLILWISTESKKPLRISLIHGDHTQTFEYVSYQDNLEFDPSLFWPPTGIAVVE
jgi:hypothetical protein